MKLLVILYSTTVIFVSLINVIFTEDCSWTECIPSNNSEIMLQTEVDCPNKEEVAVSIKLCVTENHEGGRLLYCCAQNRSEVQKDSLSFIPPSSNFMWWPNDYGVLVRASIFCPYPPPTEESVRFFLYTRKNKDLMDFKELKVDDIDLLESSEFIKEAPVKMVIHGFLSRAFQGPAKALRENYIKLPYNMNFIAVDWSKLANYAEGPSALNPFNYICYGAAAENVAFVGKRSALLLEFLIKQNYTQLEQIHVMGHSLGAHSAGYVGKLFSLGRFLRITGFDPAGPLFNNVSSDSRIDYSDAEFVDVIHTSTAKGGGLVSIGLREPVGHADFYPNKGTSQPGCASFPPFLIPPFPPSPSCSHGRSYEFYGESIFPLENKVFRGVLCKSLKEAEGGNCAGPDTTLMGACTTINNSSRKIYYLKTMASTPYAMDERAANDVTDCPLN